MKTFGIKPIVSIAIPTRGLLNLTSYRSLINIFFLADYTAISGLYILLLYLFGREGILLNESMSGNDRGKLYLNAF